MNWFVNFLSTSIGKKMLMALTGIGFSLFLIIHLIGNLTLYAGKETFISYVEHLHALEPLIVVTEFGLLFFAIIHVFTGLTLFYENMMARPVRYAVNKSAGGRTLSSATMPYTGVFIIMFVVVHLMNFHFIDHAQLTVFKAMENTFSEIPYIIFYTLSVLVVAFHIRHGFWSLFQTLGANHPKYMPGIRKLSISIGIIVAIGFGFIPVYIKYII